MTLEEFIITELDFKNAPCPYIGLAPRASYSEQVICKPFYKWLSRYSAFAVNELNENDFGIDAYIVNTKTLLQLDDDESKDFVKRMNFLRNAQGEARYHFYNSQTPYSETTFKCYVYNDLTAIFKKLEKKREIYQAKLKSIENTKASLWKAIHL